MSENLYQASREMCCCGEVPVRNSSFTVEVNGVIHHSDKPCHQRQDAPSQEPDDFKERMKENARHSNELGYMFPNEAAPSQEPVAKVQGGVSRIEGRVRQLIEVTHPLSEGTELYTTHPDAAAQIAQLQTWLDNERKEIHKLEAELERERMCHAACGVVAMANTRESAEQCRKMHPEYYSASVQDVARAVDKEMDYREQIAQLTKERDAYKSCEADMAKQLDEVCAESNRLRVQLNDLAIERDEQTIALMNAGNRYASAEKTILKQAEILERKREQIAKLTDELAGVWIELKNERRKNAN